MLWSAVSKHINPYIGYPGPRSFLTKPLRGKNRAAKRWRVLADAPRGSNFAHLRFIEKTSGTRVYIHWLTAGSICLMTVFSGQYVFLLLVRVYDGAAILFNPFTPESDQSQISPPAPPEILHHTVRRTWLIIAYSDERWLSYKFSLSHLCIFSLKGWENGLFELRSERVKLSCHSAEFWNRGILNFEIVASSQSITHQLVEIIPVIVQGPIIDQMN